MNFIITRTVHVLATLLIMTLSPAQSMEMTALFELAESGIIIDFSDDSQTAMASPSGKAAPPVSRATEHPEPTPFRVELPESGHFLVFEGDNEPEQIGPASRKNTAETDVEVRSSRSVNHDRSPRTFELPESGQIIVIVESLEKQASHADGETLAFK